MALGIVHGKQFAIGLAAGAFDGALALEKPNWKLPYDASLIVVSIGAAATHVWPAAAPLAYGGLFALAESGGRWAAKKAGIGGPGPMPELLPLPFAAQPTFPGLNRRDLRPKVSAEGAGVAG